MLSFDISRTLQAVRVHMYVLKYNTYLMIIGLLEQRQTLAGHVGVLHINNFLLNYILIENTIMPENFSLQLLAL